MNPEHRELLPRHQAVFDRDNGPKHLSVWTLDKLFTHHIAKRGSLTVIGKENIPESAIIAPNHLDHWDHAAIGKSVRDITGRPIHFAAKPEFWYEGKYSWINWFNGRLVEHGGGFPIDRNTAWHAQPEEVRRKIHKIHADHDSLAIYGQGTRVDPEEPVKIMNGIAILALAYGWPIIPAGIAGTIEREDMVVVYKKALHPKRIGLGLLESRRNVALHTIAIRSLTHTLQENIQLAKDEAEEKQKSLILADLITKAT